MTDNVVKLETKRTEEVPDFITRRDIERMSDVELDELVGAIRARRMAPIEIYQRTKAEKAAVAQEKDRARIEKKCEQIIKDIAASDKALDKLELHISELRGLRVQAGMSII